MELLKKIIAFVIALFISFVIFYSFFAMLGITFKIILNAMYIFVLVLVALPFYVIIKKKLLK
jgi:hypothetical protein